MSITVAIEPPGYREPNVRSKLEIENITSVVMGFYGDCMGVVLVNRVCDCVHAPCMCNNKHLKFVMLYEDDGWWYENKGVPTDSYWLPEMIEALQEAHRWLKAHARKSKDGLGWESKK
jgi:hypothetical protein